MADLPLPLARILLAFTLLESIPHDAYSTGIIVDPGPTGSSNTSPACHLLALLQIITLLPLGFMS